MKAIWCDQALVYNPYKLALCLTEKQYRHELRKLGIPEKLWSPFVLEGCQATTHTFDNVSGGSSVILICVDDGCATLNQIHAILVHEAMHVWQRIKKAIGEKRPSKEFEAYSMQSITQRLFNAYDEMRKKRK